MRCPRTSSSTQDSGLPSMRLAMSIMRKLACSTSLAATGLRGIHPVLQLALQLQIHLPHLRQLRFVRLLPEATLHRFHKALDNVAQGPRVLLLEKLLYLWVQDILVSELRIHPVLDHV